MNGVPNDVSAVFLAIASAVVWAVSAPIVSRGLSLLPVNRIGAMVLGLMIALFTGSSLLLLAFGTTLRASDVTPATVVAGALTFPMATGIYYVASAAFKGRAEVAAQFSQLKPVISVLLAVFLLNEPLHGTTWLSLAFVAAGLGLLIVARRHGHVSAAAVALGLMLASMWAFGEVAIAYGDAGRGVQQTTVALLAGTLVGTVFAIPTLAVVGWPAPGRWMFYFMLHGVLSFGIAYALYFDAIRQLGLGPTALINAFWPMLSLVLAHVLARRRPDAEPIPRLVWLAALLLLLGSLAAIWGGTAASRP